MYLTVFVGVVALSPKWPGLFDLPEVDSGSELTSSGPVWGRLTWKPESCCKRSLRSSPSSVLGLIEKGCSGDLAVSVEHSLSGLVVFIDGAVVEGVVGWGSSLFLLTSAVGVSTTFFVTVLEQSLGSSNAVLCWDEELC